MALSVFAFEPAFKNGRYLFVRFPAPNPSANPEVHCRAELRPVVRVHNRLVERRRWKWRHKLRRLARAADIVPAPGRSSSRWQKKKLAWLSFSTTSRWPTNERSNCASKRRSVPTGSGSKSLDRLLATRACLSKHSVGLHRHLQSRFVRALLA